MNQSPLEQFKFIGISELQKISSARLAKLTHGPLIVSDKNQPKFVILSRSTFEQMSLPDTPYEFLVKRPHAWRTQLWIKGKNMSAFQVVSHMHANKLLPEQAAEDLSLPKKAVYESLHYYENNKDLIDMEASEEKRRLSTAGYSIDS